MRTGIYLRRPLACEFGFGWARGRSWEEMPAPYAFQDGNIWPLGLLVTALAPWLATRAAGRGAG